MSRSHKVNKMGQQESKVWIMASPLNLSLGVGFSASHSAAAIGKFKLKELNCSVINLNLWNKQMRNEILFMMGR